MSVLNIGQLNISLTNKSAAINDLIVERQRDLFAVVEGLARRRRFAECYRQHATELPICGKSTTTHR